MINMNGRQNEYWTASPLKPKSGSNIAKLLLTLHKRFLFLPFTLLDLNRCVYEDTCNDGDSDAYKCVHVIVQSRQKKKRVPLTQKETAHAYSCCLIFNALKSVVLKLQCLKTRDHATDVVPRLGTSSSLCPGWSFSTCFCLLLTPPWWAAYKDRSHSNYEKVFPQTMYFLTPRNKR